MQVITEKCSDEGKLVEAEHEMNKSDYQAKEELTVMGSIVWARTAFVL